MKINFREIILENAELFPLSTLFLVIWKEVGNAYYQDRHEEHGCWSKEIAHEDSDWSERSQSLLRKQSQKVGTYDKNYIENIVGSCSPQNNLKYQRRCPGFLTFSFHVYKHWSD